MDDGRGSQWLTSWVKPLAVDNFCGEDACFSTEFEALKAEVDKDASLHATGSTDWVIVLRMATEFLDTHSKDVWALAYGTYALHRIWAGDSRCYLFRDGVLYQCTKDHTLRQEKIDKGELTAPEARRMVRGNIITNAVGIRDELLLEEVRFSLRAGDRFLLCSDGLSNLMAPEALSASLTKATAKETVERIIEAISGMTQPDNITFVTIFISEPV